MHNEKTILCDSSSLITLTSSCMDRVLYFLNEKFGVRFVIPPMVEHETITRPLYSHAPQFAFSAIRIKDAVNDGILVKVGQDVQHETRRIMELANNIFHVSGAPLRLIHAGEAEMLALAANLDITELLVDERTVRMLAEAPFRLREHLEEEFNKSVLVDKKKMRELADITDRMDIMRSSEMVILAYENGFFSSFGDIKREALESVLYKIKYSGCSIRLDEIREYMKMIK